jgi:hypothetical protein
MEIQATCYEIIPGSVDKPPRILKSQISKVRQLQRQNFFG